ncbi:MAG: 3'-5' exonuclease, partial [Myxococcota bacterium]|nr:3'-5' exonuclease [Myxococcota bacterium]
VARPVSSEPSEKDSASLHPIVVEEESLLADVHERLKTLPPEANIDVDAMIREMEKLREDIQTSDHDERPALLMQYERLGHLLESAGRSQSEDAVDPDKPYFAHMRLREGQRDRDVFLGKATRLDHGLRIVDWRHAPVSRVFYTHAEGDEYDEFFGEREVSGEVLARRTLGMSRGELVRVQAPQGLFLKDGEGWRQASSGPLRLEGGAGTADWVFHDSEAVQLGGQQLGAGAAYRLDKYLPEISALIDPQQWDLISDEESQLVVVRGVAGSGKTTVALHRLAYLNYQSRSEYRADRMLVVVWGDALRRFIGKVLPALGVRGTPVRTYAFWAGKIRRRLFNHLPRNQSEDTPAVVTRLKLHPVMLAILRRWVEEHPGPKTVRQAVDDWCQIITDRVLLSEGIARWAPGAFTEAEVERFVSWTSHQIDRVDEFLNPTDEPQLDDPAAADEVHEEAFLDAEDDPLLLRLYQLRVGPIPAKGSRGVPLSYSHLVIDEVQDLSPLEVRVLLDCTDSKKSVTLAGDTQQHVLQEAGFTNWEEFFDHLGVRGTSVSTLQVAYRSTRPIVRFARHVLGPLKEDEEPLVPREGVPVEILPFDNHGEALAFIADALRHLARSEPSASIALLARERDTASLYFDGLVRSGLERIRLVTDQDFAFAPGIEVCDVAQSKGLEFDYVVLLDVSALSYPDTPAARRILHVGSTRAAHQLWVTLVGRPSPLLA